MIYVVLDRESIAVTGTPVGLTPAKLTSNVVYARVQVQTAQVRATEDGTTPNPSTPIGEIYDDGDQFEVWGSEAMSDFLAVRETSTSAVLEVTYLGSAA